MFPLSGVLMRTSLLSALLVVSSLAAAAPPEAAAAVRETTRLPSQDLDSALQSFVKQRHLQIIYRSDVVKGIKGSTRSIEGYLSAQEVLHQLLSGTGLTFRFLDDKTVMIAPSSKSTTLTAFPTPLRLSQAGSALSTSVESESSSLQEVVVTAQKRSQNVLDVPLSVTALSGDALHRAGIDSILSLSYSVPSLVVQETGGGFQRYFIRGVGNGNSSTSLVGIYLDEADVTTNGNSQLNLRAVDLERVEVLKGPQGTLYGAGSAGGTIRFITRDPDLSKITGMGDIQFYTTRYGAPSQEVTGVLNLPLLTDQLGVRIVGTYANLGGWIDQPAAGTGNINNQDLRDIRIKTAWQPNENLSVKALVDVNRNSGHGTNASADSSYNLQLAVDPTLPTPFKSNYDVYNLTASYALPAVTLLSSSTYLDTLTQAVVGLKYSVAPAPEPLFEFLNAPDTRVTHSFSQEFRVASVRTTPFHWLAGVFYKDLSIHYTTDFLYGYANDPLGGGLSTNNESSKSVSVFADGGYDITPAWELGGGVRYFHDDRTAYNGDELLSGQFHNVAPRVYTSYALTDEIRAYASASDGFRSGGFNPGEIDNPTYAPEKIRSYEIGTKGAFLDHKLTSELAVFFSRYQNMQYFIPTPDGIGMLSNAGTSHIWGVDGSLDWQATPHLLLSFNGNVTRSRVVKLLPGVTAVIEGDPVDFATDYSARVAATYSWNVTETIPAFAHVEFSRVGPSHNTDRGEGGDPILFTTDVINMLNARVGITRSGWSFELFGDNLANANGIQDAVGAFGFGSRPRPRTLGVEIRAELE